ncbi:MAG: hypothetical protein NWQ31_11945 [Polaribacter sp.]|nr:hypothetical protein [Polaribacter sp.]
MKNKLLLFFLLIAVFGYSQEKRKLINGKILFDKTVISDVHIININTNQGTITNDDGWFEIPVSIGDSLKFTHVNLNEKHLKISKETFINKEIIIHLEEKTYSLNEITLEKPKSIFYVDPEMVPPTVVNAKTLNLPYANTTVKKDNSIVSFRSGGVVSLDNLINSLNGTNRRRKELIKISNEDNELTKIRNYFTDDFFITDLHIKEEFINPFLNYCLEQNIITYFHKNDHLKVTTILMEESKMFPQKINSDSIVVFQK